MQGLHLLRLSIAVNWIAVDHVLLGCVSKLKVLSSNFMTPLPAAASLTSWSCSASSAAETRASGSRRRARIWVHNILGWLCQRMCATCLMTKKEIRRFNHTLWAENPVSLPRITRTTDDNHCNGRTLVRLGGRPISLRFTHTVNTTLGVGRKTSNTTCLTLCS